eukprot:5187386-Pleurochrysis_carterae.AAC.3
MCVALLLEVDAGVFGEGDEQGDGGGGECGDGGGGGGRDADVPADNRGAERARRSLCDDHGERA